MYLHPHNLYKGDICMTIEIFIIGLTACSLFTGLLTEAMKKMLNDANKDYKSNILAAICSVIVSVIVIVAYALITSTAITVPFVTSCVLLVILSWLCAMVGYDKVIQTIAQIMQKD